MPRFQSLRMAGAGLALALAGCGGSPNAWSEPRLPNAAPSVPVVTGPVTGITLHPAAFRFSAVDPEADPITFLANGVAIAGSELTWTPTQAGPSPLRVAARDSFGHTSAETVHAFDVAPNHPPVIASPSELEWLGSDSVLDRAAAIQILEEDGDGIELTWAADPVVRDGQGRPVPAVSASLEAVPSGLQVHLRGALPVGANEILAWLPLRARDLLPGGSPVGTEATQNLFIHYQIVP